MINALKLSVKYISAPLLIFVTIVFYLLQGIFGPSLAIMRWALKMLGVFTILLLTVLVVAALATGMTTGISTALRIDNQTLKVVIFFFIFIVLDFGVYQIFMNQHLDLLDWFVKKALNANEELNKSLFVQFSNDESRWVTSWGWRRPFQMIWFFLVLALWEWELIGTANICLDGWRQRLGFGPNQK